MRKFAAILSLFAAVLLTEAHWSVMQSITWAAMIQSTDSSASFAETVLSTLSGEAPCQHCQALLEEKESQRNDVLAMMGQAPVLAPFCRSLARPTRKDVLLFSITEPDSPRRASALDPPEPPPRA